MSFAQGLLAGTQAARNVMDSYKEARDARVQREFAQGLAALDEQGAGPNQFTPDMMPEAAPDPNAPTNMAGLANTPQMTAPTMPLNPQQRLQQQIALANRLGLRQEAANFTNQLGQLTQREEDMQYRAQRDTMSDIYRDEELEARKAEAVSQAEKRAAETKQIEAQNTAAEQERSAKLATISASNATRGALMSGGSLTPVFDEGRKVFANDPVALQAYTNAIYDTFTKSTGLTEGEVNNAVSSVLRPLKQFINTPYDDPAKMLAGFERVLDSVDHDLTDNIRPEAVARPDGTWAIKYGDAELPGLEGKDLQEVASKYMRTVSTDPLEAISIYDRNKNLQISKIASAKTQAKQAKLFIEFAKNNPQVMKDETAAGRLLDIIQGDVGGLSYDPKDWGTSGATSNVEALALAAKQLGVSVPEPRAGVSQTLDKQVQAKTKETEDRSKFEQDVSNMINSTAALLREQYGNDKGAMARAVREALTTPGISLVEEAALRELYRQSYLP